MSNPRRIYIRVRYRNRSSVPVILPVRLLLPRTGIVIIGSGTAAAVTASNPDSLRDDSTAVWLVGSTGTLAIGDSTKVYEPILKVDEPVQSARLTFQVLAESPNQVPAVAPDSTPAWFGNDSSWSSGRLKRVLIVRFTAGATASQKSAALDSVGGIVVGGYHLTQDSLGTYYIYIPSIASDSALFARSWVLNRQPGVVEAGIVLKGVPSGQRPEDGLFWKRKDWIFNRDSSNFETWAFEEVNLPLAWGCQTGMPNPGIGLIESRVPNTGEFVVNSRSFVPSPSSTDSTQKFHREHGKWVASILAAKGNDSTGGTGALWRAQIDPFALGRNTVTNSYIPIEAAIDSLRNKGDLIIITTVHPPRDTNFAGDTANTNQWARRVVRGISNGTTPLLIVSAGNDNRDASLTAYGLVRSQFPNNVVLVGASEYRAGIQRNRWGGPGTSEHLNSGSNHGGSIDVYAPGAAVGVYDPDSAKTIGVWGTSFAAPFVAGIAGLLKAFDPRLTPSELKNFIVQGADSGRIQVGNTGTGGPKYLVDAYESLKLAAQRTGAPLCGNRLWVENQDSIKVQRGTGAELLFTSPDTLGVLFTTHGGRRIDFQARPSLKGSLTYSPTGWTASYPTGSFNITDWSGTVWSLFGRTHDADSVVSPSLGQFGGITGVNSATFNVLLGVSPGSGRALYNNMTIALVAPDQTIPIRRNAQTDSSGNFIGYVDVTTNQGPGNTYRTAEVRSVPSPFGDRVVVLINYFDFPLDSITAWYPGVNAVPIGSEWSYQERVAAHHPVSQRADVWSIPWSGGTRQLRWSRPNNTIAWFGLAENGPASGAEAVMAIGAKGVGPDGFANCRVQYTNVLTGDSLRTRSAPLACGGALDIGVLAPTVGLVQRAKAP
jgi:hypothetical protein